MKWVITNAGELESLRRYAEQPEHWYYPERGDAVPGNSPDFTRRVEVLYSATGPWVEHIRVVFTHTVSRGKRLLHATFSTDNPEHHLPSVAPTFAIARQLGFDDGSEHFMLGQHLTDEGVIVMAQDIGEERCPDLN